MLLLGGTLGMMLMASANHLLMVYIAVEMASVPSYALAGFLKGKRQASEAALKYVVYGGGASGVMLYGISLIAGRVRHRLFARCRRRLRRLAGRADRRPVDRRLLVLGIAVHPDRVGVQAVGRAVPFLVPGRVRGGRGRSGGVSVGGVAKRRRSSLTGRLILTFDHRRTSTATDACRHFRPAPGCAWRRSRRRSATWRRTRRPTSNGCWRIRRSPTPATCSWAWRPSSAEGVAAVLFYLATYLFTNLGAFAVVAFVRNRTGSEDLSAYRGLIYRSPVAGRAHGRVPAEPARHPAAGRVRRQVPDLLGRVITPAKRRPPAPTHGSATFITPCW